MPVAKHPIVEAKRPRVSGVAIVEFCRQHIVSNFRDQRFNHSLFVHVLASLIIRLSHRAPPKSMYFWRWASVAGLQLTGFGAWVVLRGRPGFFMLLKDELNSF